MSLNQLACGDPTAPDNLCAKEAQEVRRRFDTISTALCLDGSFFFTVDSLQMTAERAKATARQETNDAKRVRAGSELLQPGQSSSTGVYEREGRVRIATISDLGRTRSEEIREL